MRVYIVGRAGACQYAVMYREAGFDVVMDIEDADIVQFTGGEDVSPELYGEHKHPETFCNPARDQEEKDYFTYCLRNKIPMVGICRGAQFLNVLNGGSMYQHVDNHAISGTHNMTDFVTGVSHHVTSTHHQMMIAGPEGQIVGGVIPARSTYRESFFDQVQTFYPTEFTGDTEVVFYTETNSLCFQPHPEYDSKGCREYFFELLNRYIIPEVK